MLGRVLRSALIVDGCALVELSVGMRGAATPERGEESLITLVDRQRGEEGWDLLRQLAETIPDATRTDLRWLRDKLGAHIDAHVSLSTLEQALDGLDVNGLIALLDHVLDWLDAAACSHVDLGTLLLGGRAMRSLEASEAPSVVPDDALAELARHADSPYVVMVGGRHGASRTGAVGAIAGRVTNRRQKWSARVKRGSAA